MQENPQYLTTWPAHDVVRGVTWLFASLAMLNTLCFVLRASEPFIQADNWWFLDVFLRKAMNGSLGFADFFIKRSSDDHAQPLFKLELLLEWRYFDLDFVVGAVFGVVAAAACAVILYRIVFLEICNDGIDVRRHLAWATMCALLFSLNSMGTWIWPLVALENITTLVILLFMLAAWRAYQRQRYLVLVIATLLLAISSDDSALIAVAATVPALLLAWFRDPAKQTRSVWQLLAVIGACMLLVQIGYAFVPGAGGALQLASRLVQLFGHFRDGGWWKWVVLPLALPVVYENPFQLIHPSVWLVIQSIMAALLLIAHVLFWRRAFRGPYNRPVFLAVSLMLLCYGWVVGILLLRVTAFGNDYLNQPRYVLLYSGHLIALLLMWAGSLDLVLQRSPWWRTQGAWAPVAGCLILLAVQIPMSIHAWHVRKFLDAYYAKVASQIDEIAKDSERSGSCEVMPICRWSPKLRGDLTQLLSKNRLNIYSPRVQRWHHYLPRISPLPAATKPDVENADKMKPH